MRQVGKYNKIMDTADRLSTELELLESMYPEQVKWNSKAREVKYTTGTGSFELRIPDGYLNDTLPEVLSASSGKHDLRNKLKTSISKMEVGEEILDSIISTFNDLTESLQEDSNTQQEDQVTASSSKEAKATVVVYLHHLLNTNKRKQALSPPSASVSGVTKPGYPGVLIYSGPSKDVWEHVNELKGLNWQTFQIRLESDEEWSFKHGKGVAEVEAMKNVVTEVGEERKEECMQSMRMK